MASKGYQYTAIPEATNDIMSLLRTVNALRQAVQTLIGDRNPNDKGLVGRVSSAESIIQGLDAQQAVIEKQLSLIATVSQSGVHAENASSTATDVSATLTVSEGSDVDIIAYFSGQPGAAMPAVDAGKTLALSRVGLNGTITALTTLPVQYVAAAIGFSTLPTDPPTASGALWNNNGALSITPGASAGPNLCFLQTIIAWIDTPPAGNTTYKLTMAGGTKQGPLVIQAVERKK